MATAGAPAAAAQVSRLELFRGVHDRPQDLARYGYLISVMPKLSEADRVYARQFLASTENELGLYSEAIRDFPLQNKPLEGVVVPHPDRWEAVDAADAITQAAASRQIVLINEAHHDGHTRVLALALLPRLRAAGYTYFAVEALDGRDIRLADRGYPVASSGSEYVHDPIYGELIRRALHLGYKVVPYEAVNSTGQDRETGQAKNLYERVFAHDPEAKVLVQAGYAHIDKSRGRLGSIRPMAMELQHLTGIEPLSIDQTDVREDRPVNELDAIHRAQAEYAMARSLLTARGTTKDVLGNQATRDYRSSDLYFDLEGEFHPDKPVILVNRHTGAWWSARPRFYDANVVLPRGNDSPSDYSQGAIGMEIDGRRYAAIPPAAGGHRPRWLALGGERVAVTVDDKPCSSHFPCLAEAIYARESDDAVAADRYLILQRGESNVLYLRPGAYRLRYIDIQGIVLDSHALDVPAKDESRQNQQLDPSP